MQARREFLLAKLLNLYTFLDRNEESLTLRPEGTAGTVRAMLEHGLTGGGQVQKLWYTGPMFRYEKPQKGRYRQFHQIGVEVFNLPGPDIDAEQILMCARLWDDLGIDGLEVRHPGHQADDTQRLGALVAHFDLVPSGGSDWHGAAAGSRALGAMQVNADWLAQQDARIAERHGAGHVA